MTEVSKNIGLEEVYNFHHSNNRNRGQSILKNARGRFLRKTIGTGKIILDVGCRDGALTSEFFSGNKIWGLDIDKEALKIASKTLGIEVVHTDLNAENWAVPDTYFDVAVAGEVLEHLYFPEKVIKRISNKLKPGGIFIGSVPNAFNLMNRMRLFLGEKKNTPLSDPTHINHFSRGELKELLNTVFSDVKLHPLGRFAFLDRFFPGFFSFGLMFECKK